MVRRNQYIRRSDTPGIVRNEPAETDTNNISSSIDPSGNLVDHGFPPNHLNYEQPSSERIYGVIYRWVFAFVHVILTVILAPILKHSSTRKHGYSPSRRANCTDLPIYHASCCPEGASPMINQTEPSSKRPFSSPPSAISRSSSGSVLKPCRDKSNPQQQQPAGIKRSVHFEPDRRTLRPPLGRIEILNHSSTSSLASSSGSSSTSYSSESYLSGRTSLPQSTNKSRMQRSFDRIMTASSPRAHHSTYFLND